MLPGIVGNSASTSVGGGSTTLTFANNYGSFVLPTNISVAGFAIGAAASNRYVVVAVTTTKTSGTATTISSVTVGGAACTKLYDQTNGLTSAPRLTLWITNAPVTSGTTATFAMTASSTYNYVGIATWALNASSPTVFDAITGQYFGNASNPLNKTIDVAANGSVIVATSPYAATSITQSYSGVTKNFEGSDGNLNFSAGSLSTGSAETDRAISVTSDGVGGTDGYAAYIIVSFTSG